MLGGLLLVSLIVFILAVELPLESEEWHCYSVIHEGETACRCDGNSSGGNGSCINEVPLFYTAGIDATNQTGSHCRAFAACTVGSRDCNGGPVTGGCLAKEGYVQCNNLPPEKCAL